MKNRIKSMMPNGITELERVKCGRVKYISWKKGSHTLFRAFVILGYHAAEFGGW
jgi:hypothetical protein